MNLNDLLEKIELLETRQAFQEDTIESLNVVIIQQQKRYRFVATKSQRYSRKH